LRNSDFISSFVAQFNRPDIIGKNCKFLQPVKEISKEIPQHTLMVKSLREALPTSIIITNIKKAALSSIIYYH
jgi:hypothetical protein